MIKEGQIYKREEWILCVTLYSPVDIYVIYENGCSGHWSKKEDFLKDSVLVAEYPTWQEAVNSPEFNEVKND